MVLFITGIRCNVDNVFNNYEYDDKLYDDDKFYCVNHEYVFDDDIFIVDDDNDSSVLLDL